MLGKFESILICLIVAVCFMSAGCSSLRTSDTDELLDTNSRLVDMPRKDLDSLVSAENEVDSDTGGLPRVANEKGFSLEPNLEVVAAPDMELLESAQLENLEVSEVSHVKRDMVAPSNDRTLQKTKSLSGSLSPKAELDVEEEPAAERIIILKAKSSNASNANELMGTPDNPATFQKSFTSAPTARGRGLAPGQLSPITVGWAPRENMPTEIISASPANKDAEVANCEPAPCQSGLESSEGVEADVVGQKPIPLGVTELKGGSEGHPLQPVAVNSTESKVAEMEGGGHLGGGDTSQFDPNHNVSQNSGDLSHVTMGATGGEAEFASVETGELVAAETAIAQSGSSMVSWDVQLKTTIDAFEDQIIDLSLTDYRRPKLQQSLAILQVLDDRLSSGRIALEQPRHRQYWQFQLTAILNMLQAAKTNSVGGQENVSTAIDQLRSAVVELQKLSDLKIVKLEFCSEVSGYGQFVPMDSEDFLSDSQTLVYCEIENFTPVKELEDTREVYATRLECHLQIIDHDDQVIQTVDFPVVQDIAVNHRRDFYMHLPLTLDNIKAGRYTVKLEVKDLASQKSAHWSTMKALTVR